MEKKQSPYFSIKVNVADAFLPGKTAEISEEMYWNDSVYVKICQVTFFYGEAIVLQPRDIIL